MAESKLESLVSRLEKVVEHLEANPVQGIAQKPAAAAGSLLPSLADFNELLNEFEQQGNKLDLIELHEMVNIMISLIWVFIFNAFFRPKSAVMRLEP